MRNHVMGNTRTKRRHVKGQEINTITRGTKESQSGKMIERMLNLETGRGCNDQNELNS